MWLDELDEMRRSLQRRINDHYEALAGSESTVRYALVNPLLRALGWDLDNPERVRTEYRVEEFRQEDGKWKAGYLDYVLLQGQERLLVVEAKALGRQLDDEAVDQCIRYCYRNGPGHFVVTNGRKWRGYYLFAQGGASKNQDFEFDMNDSPTMDLLWLWPGNFQGDRARPVPKPRIEAEEQASITLPRPTSQAPTGATSGVSLTEVKYVKDMDKPRRLIFPNGEAKDVRNLWWRIQAVTAEWLIDHNHVKSLPVQTGRGAILLYKKKTSRDVTPFRDPKEVRGHWIEASAGAKQHLHRAMELLKLCGVNPTTVHVELS